MHLVRQPKSLFQKVVDGAKLEEEMIKKENEETTDLEKNEEQELDSSSDEERESESQDSSKEDSKDSRSEDDDDDVEKEVDSNETKETEDMEEKEEKDEEKEEDDVELEGVKEEDDKVSPSDSQSQEGENVIVIDTKDLDSSKWDVDTIMSKFTSKELKEMCKMRSLSLNGSKRDLAVRVVEHKNNQS